MLARCFCPKHGKLDFDDIHIDAGLPVCKKCKSPLEFGKVKPKRVGKPPKTEQGKKAEKKKKPNPKVIGEKIVKNPRTKKKVANSNNRKK